MIAGISSGLAAALFQSLSYLATRHYVQRRTAAGTPGSPRGGSSRQLLVLGHVWMGLFSIILLALIWPRSGLPLNLMLEPMLLMTGFYLAGQCATTFALRYAEPSRVSPLLGFKIVILAGMASFFEQPRITGAPLPPGLTPLQYIAAGIAVVAAFSLNYAGGALRKRAAASILFACITYSLSDWNITRTNLAVFRLAPGVTVLQASLISAGLCYVLSGLVGLALLPAWGSRRPQDWRDALTFSLIWFVAILFLYACFSESGPLLGNILQSTRGLISILLGSLLIHLGHLHIEPLASRRVFTRRLLAGLLMFAAVSLYVIRDPQQIKLWWTGHAGISPWSTHPQIRRLYVPTAGTTCSTRATCANGA